MNADTKSCRRPNECRAHEKGRPNECATHEGTNADSVSGGHLRPEQQFGFGDEEDLEDAPTSVRAAMFGQDIIGMRMKQQEYS